MTTTASSTIGNKDPSSTTGMKLYPFGRGPWPGFTHARTLRDLIARLALYIEAGAALDLECFPLEHDAVL